MYPLRTTSPPEEHLSTFRQSILIHSNNKFMEYLSKLFYFLIQKSKFYMSINLKLTLDTRS